MEILTRTIFYGAIIKVFIDLGNFPFNDVCFGNKLRYLGGSDPTYIDINPHTQTYNVHHALLTLNTIALDRPDCQKAPCSSFPREAVHSFQTQ